MDKEMIRDRAVEVVAKHGGAGFFDVSDVASFDVAAQIQIEQARALVVSGRRGLALFGDFLEVDSVNWLGEKTKARFDLRDPASLRGMTTVAKICSLAYGSQAGSALAVGLADEACEIEAACLVAPLNDGGEMRLAALAFSAQVESRDAATVRLALDELQEKTALALRSLAKSGRLAKVFSVSFVLYDQAALESGAIEINAYFNSVGGAEPKLVGARLAAQLAAKLEEFGMAACAWIGSLCDAAEWDFDARPACALVVGHAGALLLVGNPGTPASGMALDLRVSAADLSALPYVNPMPGGLGQNSRDLGVGAATPTAISRLQDAVGIARRMEAGDAPEVLDFEIEQTGANARRVTAAADRTKWSLSTTSRGEELEWASCDIALVDGQSSSAAFGCLALAAKAMPTDFDAFARAVAQHGKALGLDFSELGSMAGQVMDGAKTDAEKARRMANVCRILLRGEFPVIFEFPRTQRQSAQVARKANLATPQTTADMIGASMRSDSRQVVDAFNRGRKAAIKAGLEIATRIKDVKGAAHEPDGAFSAQELVNINYIGGAACADSFAKAPSKTTLKRQDDRLGAACRARTLKEEGLSEKTHASWDVLAADMTWSATQALSRAMFVSASHKSQVVKTYGACLGDTMASCEVVDAIYEAGVAACAAGSAQDMAEATLAQIEIGKAVAAKRGFKASSDVKKTLASELERWEACAKRCEKKAMTVGEFVEVVESQREQALVELSKHENGEMAVKMAELMGSCLAGARQLKKDGDSGAEFLPLDVLSRMILASCLFSHSDSPLDRVGFKGCVEMIRARVAAATRRLGQKLAAIKRANAGVAARTTEIKALSRLSQDASRVNRQGFVGKAMPVAWDGETLDAWPSASIWLLHAGISVEGGFERLDASGRAHRPTHLLFAEKP